MTDFKKDIAVEHFDDHVMVQIISEDAVAWVEENFSENFSGGRIKLAGDGAETLGQMREDGITE